MKTDQAWAADIRRTRHIGDFSEWKNHDEYKKAFDRLLRDLNAKAKNPPYRWTHRLRVGYPALAVSDGIVFNFPE